MRNFEISRENPFVSQKKRHTLYRPFLGSPLSVEYEGMLLTLQRLRKQSRASAIQVAAAEMPKIFPLKHAYHVTTLRSVWNLINYGQHITGPTNLENVFSATHRGPMLPLYIEAMRLLKIDLDLSPDFVWCGSTIDQQQVLGEARIGLLSNIISDADIDMLLSDLHDLAVCYMVGSPDFPLRTQVWKEDASKPQIRLEAILIDYLHTR